MGSEDFSLRPAVPDDVAEILRIERASHASPWGEESIRAELQKPYSHFLVLTDDETDRVLAGYIVYWLMMDDCQILNVAVDLKYRGLGFAKRLLRHAASEAIREGAKSMSLEVRKSNKPAIQLYQSLNFAITHVRKSFYSNGEDAYVMSLPLKEDGIRF